MLAPALTPAIRLPPRVDIALFSLFVVLCRSNNLTSENNFHSIQSPVVLLTTILSCISQNIHRGRVKPAVKPSICVGEQSHGVW